MHNQMKDIEDTGAGQAMAAFGLSIGGEVDLASLTWKLVAVTEEIMQPAQAPLWLREEQAPHLKITSEDAYAV